MLVEDSPDDAELLSYSLFDISDTNFEITLAESLSEAVACLTETRYDVILLDLTLPDGFGFDAYKRVHSASNATPIIILTGLNDESIANEAVKWGAQDYLIKGKLDSEILNRSIHYGIQRKNSDIALRKSEELYRTLVISMAEGVLLVGSGSRITACNPGAESILGIPASSLVGFSADDLFQGVLDEDDQPLAEHALPGKPSLRYGKSQSNLILRFQRPDNSWVWLSVNSQPILRSGERTPSAAVVSFTNITRLKVVEQELRNAKATAEAVTQQKGEFFANISHEIRTPMNAIIGMTELALSTELNATQRKYISLVKSSAESLLVLINDILDLSKMEAGKIEIDEVSFNPRELVKEILEFLNVRAQKKGINLCYQIAQDTPDHVMSDPLKLRQVIINLVGNAIKFTENGEVVVIVARQDDRSDLDTCELVFAIKDTGIGIPLEKQKLIFEPFVQADGATTRNYGGTGLGLTISRKIVRHMGGEIGVESVPGHGATFFFTLRFKIVRKHSAESTVTQRIDRRLIQDLLKEPDLRQTFTEDSADTPAALNVLLADDNELNHFLVAEIFKKTQHQLTIVTNGQLAVDEAIKGGYDLIFMDIQMPVLDGVEASRRIRLNEASNDSPRIPIVAFTARIMHDDIQKCEEAGIDYFLAKPIIIEDLIHFLETAAANKKNTGTCFPPKNQDEPRPAVLPTPHDDATASKMVFNDNELLARIGGDTKLAKKLIDMFLEQLSGRIAEIEDALNASDLPKLRLSAHTLKGEAANIGAEKLSSVALHVERAAKSGDLDAAMAHMRQIHPEAEKLVKVLESLSLSE